MRHASPDGQSKHSIISRAAHASECSPAQAGAVLGSMSSQRTPRRVYTTTPLQALALLNGEFIQQQSGYFAERLSREAGADRMAQAVRAFQLALGRPPDPQEKQAAAELIASHGAPALARALFNTNEFLYY